MFARMAKQTIIDQRSWHYRLLDFTVEGLRIKKACLYWPAVALAFVGAPFKAMILAALYTVFGLGMLIFVIGYQITMAVGWLYGHKPRYWTFMASIRADPNGKTRAFHRRNTSGWRSYVLPVLNTIGVWWIAFGLNYVAGEAAGKQFSFWQLAALFTAGVALLYLAKATYKYGIVPVVRKCSQLCPDIKYVRS